MKISVIMPSFLGDYFGSIAGREEYFNKAVRSFIQNTHRDKELIIVSDGCKITNDLVWQNTRSNYGWFNQNIHLVKIDKQPLFSGAVRQAGLDKATGDWATYLDSDDTLQPTHLANIDAAITPSVDWVYFNSYWKVKEMDGKLAIMDATLEKGKINTSNIAHRRGLSAHWDGFVGKQENWFFIQQLIENYPRRKKIAGCGYIINHNQVTSITPQPTL